MTQGQPMIVSGAGGFLYIAHKTPFGTQYTIDNFTTLSEARAFCYHHTPRIRASCEIDGILLLEREFWALIKLHEEQAKLSDVADAINTSIRAMKMSADRLRHLDLIAYDGEAAGASELVMTERGREVAWALSG
jgi:hypothetical protein